MALLIHYHIPVGKFCYRRSHLQCQETNTNAWLKRRGTRTRCSCTYSSSFAVPGIVWGISAVASFQLLYFRRAVDPLLTRSTSRIGAQPCPVRVRICITARWENNGNNIYYPSMVIHFNHENSFLLRVCLDVVQLTL